MTPVFLPPACPRAMAQPANQREEKGEETRPFDEMWESPRWCSARL